jgi:hypothetical protein
VNDPSTHDDPLSRTRKLFIEIAVYPLLLVNLVIGLLMFANLHQFLLVLLDWWYQDGGLDEAGLGPFSYIQRSVSGFGAILLGLLGLIGFSIMESYYSRSAERGSLLFWRFFRIVGIQLLFLGVAQSVTRLIVGTAPGFILAVIIAELIVGLGLLIFTRNNQALPTNGLI